MFATMEHTPATLQVTLTQWRRPQHEWILSSALPDVEPDAAGIYLYRLHPRRMIQLDFSNMSTPPIQFDIIYTHIPDLPRTHRVTLASQEHHILNHFEVEGHPIDITVNEVSGENLMHLQFETILDTATATTDLHTNLALLYSLM
jgi:hypothetical protein